MGLTGSDSQIVHCSTILLYLVVQSVCSVDGPLPSCMATMIADISLQSSDSAYICLLYDRMLSCRLLKIAGLAFVCYSWVAHLICIFNQRVYNPMINLLTSVR